MVSFLMFDIILFLKSLFKRSFNAALAKDSSSFGLKSRPVTPSSISYLKVPTLEAMGGMPVSYTHLTLPTTERV